MTRLTLIPALAVLLGFAFTSSASVNNGTYRSIPVKSDAECLQLCQSDRINCVGTLMESWSHKPDELICHLNNGEGANSPFEKRVAEPFDLHLAERELNSYRAKHGLGPVRLNPILTYTAQLHSDDQAAMDEASHSSSDGRQLADRVHEQGYAFMMVAENVASGQLSWERVFEAWQKSPGHNKNLLHPDVTELGIALTFDPNTGFKTFWTMVLGTPLESPADAEQY